MLSIAIELPLDICEKEEYKDELLIKYLKALAIDAYRPI